MHGRLRALLTLLSGGNSRASSQLLELARTGDLSDWRIDQLLRQGANVNAVSVKEGDGVWGKTALIYFLGRTNSDADVVRHLVASGADVNCQTKNGHTPLHIVFYGSLDVRARMATVAELLRAGANPNSTDRRRESPLHIACQWGTAEEVEQLLDAGAIESLDLLAEGGAPLHYTIESCRFASGPNKLAVVSTLVNHGADINLVSHRRRHLGSTPVELALLNLKVITDDPSERSSNLIEIVKYLDDLGGDPGIIGGVGGHYEPLLGQVRGTR